ncbi:hypothetical protein BN863_18030 [Formosa agariphila KMM 3901]|uniref:Uncharacterized protein n=1 Tax=Formosa agariphila (strain DSM 15362 / KCTC 12365 / LMG 23005 / KMM 3901 / M-2Alg 35-1) TaxID=1347342 RepID=T2KL99_FORAG|nr:hypothetical protein [Formosa agariphila]CDF79515.1 hypothetical protein BN863_18030 [Formosa agariphila KMM 3901]
MNFIALPLGLLILYLIDKKITKKEKINYSKRLRIISGILCALILVFIFVIQEYRKEHYNFWLGVLPSFLAAIGFPFILILFQKDIKTFFINKFLSWTVLTFIVLTIYEYILWLDGRNFDGFDILFTFFGAIISGFSINKLVPDPINDGNSKSEKY